MTKINFDLFPPFLALKLPRGTESDFSQGQWYSFYIISNRWHVFWPCFRKIESTDQKL